MAMTIVTERIEATVEAVWNELADLASHGTWMGDVQSIGFEGPLRQGIGTRMVVRTRIGPFRTRDVLEFVVWDPPCRMSALHRGLISGSGEFLLAAEDPLTSVTWRETLRFPWYLGGVLTALMARPFLRRVWKANLARLAQRINGP